MADYPTPRPYAIVRALRAGQTVDFEGVPLRATEDQTFQTGDTYVAERNVGPKLLTVAFVKIGAVFPVERAYPYDLHECIKVEIVDAACVCCTEPAKTGS